MFKNQLCCLSESHIRTLSITLYGALKCAVFFRR